MLSPLKAAIECIKRTAGLPHGGIALTALLTLALLSYCLMVLSPQQVEPLTSSSFTLPTAAAAASGVASPFRQVQKRT